jgi:glycosyltransferase involved in cell wall biosynthesis
VSGLVVPSKDSEKFALALNELYKNPTLLKKIKSNAKKHIGNKLNHEKTVKKYQEFYNRISTN